MTRSRMYILDGHNPIPVDDILEWGKWFEESQAAKTTRIVAQDEVKKGLLVFLVSTVFLGVDHNYWGGPPVLFETMVFLEKSLGTDYESPLWRYYTWEEAEAGHQKVLAEFAKGRIPMQDLMPFVPDETAPGYVAETPST